ncbi:MAG: PCMD domain-containing protein [Muribaculaceae bacterium]|nr:PCMD domain-containing protein [Muribaculaceae bacterium]
MNKIVKLCSTAALAVLFGAGLQSCALDDPFNADGEGTLQMRLVINSDVTRAENDPADLSANCVVYISGAKGLLHKYQGLENLPEQLTLKSGHYVAEAWTGDSVSASFDKKFFRGYQPFDITTGITPVVVNCKIANVVASINANSVKNVPVKDFNVKIENSRAALDFTPDNYEYAKGYYMMPNGETSLNVTVTGTTDEGRAFSKTHVIENVERSHEYVVSFGYNPSYEEEGGAFITINVIDEEILVEDEVEIFSRPSIKGVGYDIDKQIIGNAGKFSDILVKMNAFGGIKDLILSSDDYAAFGMPEASIDLMQCTEGVADLLKTSGLNWDESYNADRNMALSYLTLSAGLLNKLAERDEEYTLNLEVTDAYGKKTSRAVRIAVGEGAVVIEDPVTVEDAIDPSNLMAILSTKATLRGSLVSADAVNPGIRYRESGTEAWTFVGASASAQSARKKQRLSAAQALRVGGTSFSVTLSNLKPATRYEYQAVAEGFNSESKYFTTEGKFIIPNYSLEEWSNFADNSKVLIPGTGGQRTFWDSGNHGSATMSVTLTQGSTDMFHTGSHSGRLRSQFVGLGGLAGKFAAGNLFAGTYLETQGTDGRLEFGRPYDSSHPDALKVYVNYRPAAVQKNGAKSGYLNQGDMDKGQIYVALTTEPVEIRTKSSNQKLWNTNDPCVLAYGEKIFTGNYGPDGALQELTIPLEYKDAARSNKPLYIVIVCTASYYGDFFCGGEGSCMYVDDFELIY